MSDERSRAKRSFLFLILVMTGVAAAITVVVAVTLYQLIIHGRRHMLEAEVLNQARLIEAVFRYNEGNTPHPEEDGPGPDAATATLAQIIDAHAGCTGFGETGELTLARSEKDAIVYILRHRTEAPTHPFSVPFDSPFAVGMRKALRGESGVVTGLDYRGRTVLAAYTPIAPVDVGLVAKIDLAELREPFVKAFLFALVVGALMILVGTLFFFRIGGSIVDRLEAYSLELKREVEERRRSEEALRLSQYAIDNSIDAIYLADPDKRIIYANKAAVDTLGYTKEELLTMTVSDIDPTLVERARTGELAEFRKKESLFFETAHRRKDGTTFPVEVTASYVDTAEKKIRCIFSRDIGERKRAEAERERLRVRLAQAQKMETVGRLAGGVAHDFNNMLGVILGHSEMLIDRMSSTEPLSSSLQEIRKAARRSADLTRQLLAFARRQPIAPRVLDLNETIESMLKMLRRLIGEHIALTWLPGSGVRPVKLDPSQIDQMLANLCVNARDAIEGAGTITIETMNAALDEAYCEEHPGFKPGRYVLLMVSDDGRGMDGETLEKVFEPFFTTKVVGAGTGLGLATVYGIVKQNQGFINVYSEPGAGSTFKIYLRPHENEDRRPAARQASEPILRGRETILLVEDEATILRMTETMLAYHGYTVLAASTPREAIRLAEEHDGEIHLLMTDVIMPEMNGMELAEKLARLYPAMKRLFMSGYTADLITHHGVIDDGVNFIQKPFTMHDLAARIRDALSAE